jgi:hypothetical protein
VLPGWNGSSDLVALPGRVGETLQQGARYTWSSSTTDQRALQSPYAGSREMTTYYSPSQVKVQLSFTSAYKGNLHLYAVDWDGHQRRETITVNDGTTTQTIPISTDFDQGAWVTVPINVAAGGTVSIAVTRDAGANALLSGIMLGGSGPTPQPSTQTVPPGATQTDTLGTVFHRVGVDGFDQPAPLGSWATPDPNKVVYTGAQGLQWTEYPDGWPCGGFSHCYRPGQVLQVKGGILDFYLHRCTYPDGTVTSCGANPGPVVNGSRYMTYGRFDVRMRLTASLAGYHDAFLLWPQNEADWQCAESDYPEFDLNGTPAAFAHYGCSGLQDDYVAHVDPMQWHVYTQEWGPGWRRYYVDGTLIGKSTNQVYSGAERWQLQTEAHGGIGSAHQQIDWVWIGAP